MSQEYEITTVEDFQRVPDDRLADCLQEFVLCLLDTRTLQKQGLGLRSFVWIDDGIRMIRGIDVTVGKQTEYVPNPHFPVQS